VIDGYPVVLRLAGRPCVVVGGGAVATRKIAGLRQAGADILVVAPDVSPNIARLAEEGALRLVARSFEPGDLDGSILVVAATDARNINRAVAEAARERRILVNVADDPGACDYSVPALVRRKDITLAISTGGRSPAFARNLREQLEAWLTDARCTLLDLLTELRRELKSAGRLPDAPAWQRAIDDPDVMRAIEVGDREGARRHLFVILMAGR
jgi:precorrin-2 dehydrogenase/sirohydrochlorin ferrochelatase